MGLVYAWAFLVGASSALIYIPALTVVQRWYPNRRGLVSGVVNMVFGLSAAVMSPLYPWLLARMGYKAMTLVLGLVAAGIGLAAAGLAFGSLFAVSAPLTVDCFGLAHFGAIFGLIFTAYGFFAGIIGPWLSGFLLNLSRGDFRLIFSYLGGLYTIAAVLIWFVRPR